MDESDFGDLGDFADPGFSDMGDGLDGWDFNSDEGDGEPTQEVGPDGEPIYADEYGDQDPGNQGDPSEENGKPGSSGGSSGGRSNQSGRSGGSSSSGQRQQQQQQQQRRPNPYGNLQPRPVPRGVTNNIFAIGDRGMFPGTGDTLAPIYRRSDRGVTSGRSPRDMYATGPMNSSTVAGLMAGNSPILWAVVGIAAAALIFRR